MLSRTFFVHFLFIVILHSDLELDQTLNKQAANASGLPHGTKFTMANFTYSNDVVAKAMFRNLGDTNYQGITVSTHNTA